MQAIILAAGRGTRLGHPGPKPLAPIGPTQTLLGHQVQIIGDRVGHDRILVVVGHDAMQVLAAHPNLTYAYNDRYATTNTAKSLLLALRKIDDDVIWLNGDLYFEMDAARAILDHQPHHSRILVDRADPGDEEVKYRLGSDGAVAELSKQVREPAGESLGMNIVTRADRPALIDALETCDDQDYFERALEACIQTQQFTLLPVDVGTAFCREVDFPEDLEVVRRHVASTVNPTSTDPPA